MYENVFKMGQRNLVFSDDLSTQGADISLAKVFVDLDVVHVDDGHTNLPTSIRRVSVNSSEGRRPFATRRVSQSLTIDYKKAGTESAERSTGKVGWSKKTDSLITFWHIQMKEGQPNTQCIPMHS